MKRVVLLGLVILLGVWIVFPVASMKPDNGDRAREEITEEAVAALGRPVSVTVGEPVRDGGLLRYEGLAVSGKGSQSTAAAIHAWFDERSGAYLGTVTLTGYFGPDAQVTGSSFWETDLSRECAVVNEESHQYSGQVERTYNFQWGTLTSASTPIRIGWNGSWYSLA